MHSHFKTFSTRQKSRCCANIHSSIFSGKLNNKAKTRKLFLRNRTTKSMIIGGLQNLQRKRKISLLLKRKSITLQELCSSIPIFTDQCTVVFVRGHMTTKSQNYCITLYIKSLLFQIFYQCCALPTKVIFKQNPQVLLVYNQSNMLEF